MTIFFILAAILAAFFLVCALIGMVLLIQTGFYLDSHR